MKDTTKFKICVVIALLVWSNTFVCILYLNATKRTKTINKRITEVKSKLTQEQLESLVELTDSTKNFNYVGCYE
jgi:hypothetical protein